MDTTTKTLGELFEFYGSDKTRNGYHHIYERLLTDRRHRITEVLEVGIGTLNPDAPSTMVGYAALHYQPGGSLRAWRDYFPKATIWGLDTQPDTQFTDSRIITRLADSTDPAWVDRALDDLTFDLIIDDGDHNPASQLVTFANLWNRLDEGGIYVIEDIIGTEEIEMICTAIGMACEPNPPEMVMGPDDNLLVIHG